MSRTSQQVLQFHWGHPQHWRWRQWGLPSHKLILLWYHNIHIFFCIILPQAWNIRRSITRIFVGTWLMVLFRRRTRYTPLMISFVQMECVHLLVMRVFCSTISIVLTSLAQWKRWCIWESGTESWGLHGYVLWRGSHLQSYVPYNLAFRGYS